MKYANKKTITRNIEMNPRYKDTNDTMKTLLSILGILKYLHLYHPVFRWKSFCQNYFYSIMNCIIQLRNVNMQLLVR